MPVDEESIPWSKVRAMATEAAILQGGQAHLEAGVESLRATVDEMMEDAVEHADRLDSEGRASLRELLEDRGRHDLIEALDEARAKERADQKAKKARRKRQRQARKRNR